MGRALRRRHPAGLAPPGDARALRTRLHASCKRAIDRPATYSLEVVQLDPGTGTWLLDKPPLMPAQTYRTPDEWEARIAQARATFGKD